MTPAQRAMTRRSFLRDTLATALVVGGGSTVVGHAGAQAQATASGVPWYRRAYLWGQTNITEKDPVRYDILLMVLLAAVVAVSIKIVGVLLITAMLIIPASAARRLSRGPVAMAFGSVIAGVLAVSGGLLASLRWDTPSGPSIVAAAALLFVAGLLVPQNIWSKGIAP